MNKGGRNIFFNVNFDKKNKKCCYILTTTAVTNSVTIPGSKAFLKAYIRIVAMKQCSGGDGWVVLAQNELAPAKRHYPTALLLLYAKRLGATSALLLQTYGPEMTSFPTLAFMLVVPDKLLDT